MNVQNRQSRDGKQISGCEGGRGEVDKECDSLMSVGFSFRLDKNVLELD